MLLKKKLSEDHDRQFLFSLARQLHCTVEQLENELSYAEFLEWLDYYKLDPWGNEYFRSSMLAATMINCHRTKGKPIKLDAFVPRFKNETNADSMKDKFIGQLMSGNLKIIDNRKNKTAAVKPDV